MSDIRFGFGLTVLVLLALLFTLPLTASSAVATHAKVPDHTDATVSATPRPTPHRPMKTPTPEPTARQDPTTTQTPVVTPVSQQPQGTGQSLAATIAAAEPGSVVDLGGRSFAEDVTIDKALTLENGIDSGQIDVTASNVTLDNLDVSGGGISAHGGASGIIGLTVENSHIHDVSYAGVLLASVGNSKVLGNTITGVADGGALAQNAYGIAVTAVGTDPQSHDVEVANNTVIDVPTWQGIDTHGGKNLNIHDNIVTGACSSIWIVPNGSVNPLDITIDNNELDGNATGPCNTHAPIALLNATTVSGSGNHGSGWGPYALLGYRDLGGNTGVTLAGTFTR